MLRRGPTHRGGSAPPGCCPSNVSWTSAACDPASDARAARLVACHCSPLTRILVHPFRAGMCITPCGTRPSPSCLGHAGSWCREPSWRCDQPVLAAAQGQSSRLVGVVTRGVRGGAGSQRPGSAVGRLGGFATGATRWIDRRLLAELDETAGQGGYGGSCRFSGDRRWTPIPGLRVSLSSITRVAAGPRRGRSPRVTLICVDPGSRG
jgi:hypothetical protein